jgi:hypothetical protein
VGNIDGTHFYFTSFQNGFLEKLSTRTPTLKHTDLSVDILDDSPVDYLDINVTLTDIFGTDDRFEEIDDRPDMEEEINIKITTKLIMMILLLLFDTIIAMRTTNIHLTIIYVMNIQMTYLFSK